MHLHTGGVGWLLLWVPLTSAVTVRTLWRKDEVTSLSFCPPWFNFLNVSQLVLNAAFMFKGNECKPNQHKSKGKATKLWEPVSMKLWICIRTICIDHLWVENIYVRRGDPCWQVVDLACRKSLFVKFWNTDYWSDLCWKWSWIWKDFLVTKHWFKEVWAGAGAATRVRGGFVDSAAPQSTLVALAEHCDSPCHFQLWNYTLDTATHPQVSRFAPHLSLCQGPHSFPGHGSSWFFPAPTRYAESSHPPPFFCQST